MSRRARTLGSTLAAACVAGLVACGGGDGGDAGQMEAEGEAAQMEAGDAGQGAATTEVTLAPRGQSGIRGQAGLRRQADSLHVTLELTGLTSGESYPAHIHEGTCEQGGGVAVGLTSVSASDSTGASETTVAAADLDMQGSYFLQAHLPDGTPAACGDLPALGSSSGGSGSGGG